MKPLLLEVNANPSLNVNFDTDHGPKLRNDPQILSPIDMHVKTKVLADIVGM